MEKAKKVIKKKGPKKISKAEYKRRAAKAVATKILKNIEVKNKAFAKLSKADKAVSVAQDIIDQIKAKKYLAKHVGYTGGTFVDIDGGADAQKILLTTPGLKCDVCALGACALSIARLGNTLTVEDLEQMDKDYDDADTVMDKLSEVFDADTLWLMENAYETGDSAPLSEEIVEREGDDAYDINTDDAVAFGNKYPDSESDKRLIAIMKNVIANKGQFIPAPVEAKSESYGC